MTSLTGFAEDYVKHALKQQSSSDEMEREILQNIMDKSRKDYIDNYIIGRKLPFKRGIMGYYDKRSKASLKKAEQAFNRHFQAIVTLRNEETDRKKKLRRQQLEKRKAEENVRQERINNECTKIQTKEECVNPQNINNCYWNVNEIKNHYGDTLWEDTCQKITKRSIKIGKRTRNKIQKPTSLASISEEGGETKELSTNALTAEQRRLLTLEALNLGKDMSAGKRKRKTRKRKRRRTKKKRRRNKRKSKKNKRKSKRRR